MESKKKSPVRFVFIGMLVAIIVLGGFIIFALVSKIGESDVKVAASVVDSEPTKDEQYILDVAEVGVVPSGISDAEFVQTAKDLCDAIWYDGFYNRVGVVNDMELGSYYGGHDLPKSTIAKWHDININTYCPDVTSLPRLPRY